MKFKLHLSSSVDWEEPIEWEDVHFSDNQMYIYDKENKKLRNVGDGNKKEKTSYLRVVELTWDMDLEKLYVLRI